MSDAFLDEFERRSALRLEPEHRQRLVRALIESDATGTAIPRAEVEAWIHATYSGPLEDDQIVTFVERQLRELSALVDKVRAPLIIGAASATELDRRSNARTRKRQQNAAAKKAEAIRLRGTGRTIQQIANHKNVRLSERRVYEILAEERQANAKKTLK